MMYVLQNPKIGVSNSWAAGKKWSGPGAEILWAVARGKGQIFKQALRFLKGIARAGLRVR